MKNERRDETARTMKTSPRLLTFLLATSLSTLSARAAEDFDPETKAALEAARKAAEKAGVKMPDVRKMIEDAEAEDAAEKKADAKGKPDAGKPAAPATKMATQKPEPLKALPDWITPLPDFKPAHGGRRWAEEGVEKGELTGSVPGAPRDVAAAWAKAAKEHFRGVTTNDVMINGALTMTVFATYLKEEQLEHRVELELKPAKAGKTTTVKFNYSIGGEP